MNEHRPQGNQRQQNGKRPVNNPGQQNGKRPVNNPRQQNGKRPVNNPRQQNGKRPVNNPGQQNVQRQVNNPRQFNKSQRPDNDPRQKNSQRPVNSNRQAAVQNTVPPVRKKVKYYYDYTLLLFVIVLGTFGLLMVYSSSQYVAMVNKGDPRYYFERQAMIFFVCLTSCFFVSKLCKKKITYKLLRPLGNIILVGATGIQLMTLIMGLSSHGKTRWLSIAGISFQPAEITKIAIIIYLAANISKLGYKVNQPKQILKMCAAISIPILAILSENLSSGIITAGIAFVMLYIACRNWKVFAALAGLGVTAVLGLKPLMHEIIVRFNLGRPDHYQLRRIFGWAAPDLFPTDAYQTLQGLYAIGSGGMTGQGLGESIQKFGKLPEAHNDMIFPIVIEELGLIGATAIVILFVFLIYRLVLIASNSSDLFGSMLCVGIIAHLSIQVILNIAVVTGVIPNTGVTLPFISYGGSAILCTMIEITLALNVSNCIRIE